MALTFYIIGILKSSKCNKQEINTFLEEKKHQRKLLHFNLESFCTLVFRSVANTQTNYTYLKIFRDKTG